MLRFILGVSLGYSKMNEQSVFLYAHFAAALFVYSKAGRTSAIFIETQLKADLDENCYCCTQSSTTAKVVRVGAEDRVYL